MRRWLRGSTPNTVEWRGPRRAGALARLHLVDGPRAVGLAFASRLSHWPSEWVLRYRPPTVGERHFAGTSPCGRYANRSLAPCRTQSLPAQAPLPANLPSSCPLPRVYTTVAHPQLKRGQRLCSRARQHLAVSGPSLLGTAVGAP